MSQKSWFFKKVGKVYMYMYIYKIVKMLELYT